MCTISQTRKGTKTGLCIRPDWYGNILTLIIWLHRFQVLAPEKYNQDPGLLVVT